MERDGWLRVEVRHLAALRAVAEEMEAALIRSAFSPNIKERHDCSTAIFDGAGRMVVQSASIPVHLGAMPEAVDAVRARGAAPQVSPRLLDHHAVRHGKGFRLTVGDIDEGDPERFMQRADLELHALAQGVA